MDTNQKSLFLSLFPLVLLMVACLFYVHRVPLSDYAGYYFGSKEVLAGHYPNAYDLFNLNERIAAGGYNGEFASYAPFPPFTAVVLAPFLGFSAGVSKLVFGCFCGLFFVSSMCRCARHFSMPGVVLLALPVVFLLPLVNNFIFGQAYLLLCGLLVEGFIAYRQEKTVLSSLLWALAILFKIFPGFIFFFLLLRMKYKQAAMLALACVVLLSLSLLFTGWEAWKYYVVEMLPKVNNGELNDPFALLFQSAFMLLKRAFVYDPLLNVRPMFSNPYLFMVGVGVFKALVLSACMIVSLREKKELRVFAIWLLGSMLISPNGSNYSLILLVVAFFAFFQGSGRGSGVEALLVPAAILFMACILPISWFGRLPILLQFPRLYLLLALFGMLLPLRRSWHPGLAIGLALLFVIPAVLRYGKEKDGSTYLFTREEHSCIYDYTVKDGRLVYSYLDNTGHHLFTTDVSATTMTGDGIELKEGQIWFRGVRLTSSRDVKRKPMLVDGVYILYLSDKNRGPGFYTLRKLIPVAAGEGVRAAFLSF